VADEKVPNATRLDPHPLRDLFIPELNDYAPKDHKDMMERPFFSIAKRKRLKPIEYRSEDGTVTVKVSGNPEHGIATIWDADIIIYCISRIVAARNAGDNDAGPSIFVTPYELLKGIARDTGGKNYSDLIAAIKRLKTTTIETNIRGENKRLSMFNWLAEIEGDGSNPEHPNQLQMMELRLSNWLHKGIMSGKGVLTLDREWFLLKGGLERVLYRIARKHAGEQPQGWTCRDEIKRNFAARVRNMAKRNNLPRYDMSLTTTADGSPAVHFIARRFLRQEVNVAAALETSEYTLARAAWIDSGRDPRGFQKEFDAWRASGASAAQFIATYSDPVTKLGR